MEDPYTRINTGRAVMNREKFDKILTAFSHAQKKLPACILQCKDCLSDRCELPFHEPTFHDPIDTGKSLSEALLFAEHGENMLCTKIVLNVRNSMFELVIQ